MREFVEYKGEKFFVQTSGRYYQSDDRKAEYRLLHRRVWAEANGPIPDGHVIHHIDGDWRNNDLSNLELKESTQHMREHMLERFSDPEYKKFVLESLDKAQKAAVHWHKSVAGRNWHKKHGKKSWINRKPEQVACVVCGTSFESFFPTRTKYCSSSCYQKLKFQENKTSKGSCVLCGKEFFFNKYRKQECCSRSCGNKLRVIRSKS